MPVRDEILLRVTPIWATGHGCSHPVSEQSPDLRQFTEVIGRIRPIVVSEGGLEHTYDAFMRSLAYPCLDTLGHPEAPISSGHVLFPLLGGAPRG